MTLKIKIPEIYHASKHCHSLFEIWQTTNQKLATSADLAIDFQQCKFLSHLGVAFLGGLAHHVQKQGGQLTFEWDTLKPEIRMNLSQNGFLSSFEAGSESWKGNSIPYRQDKDQNKCAIMDYLLNSWLRRGWVNISSDLQEAIAGNVWEMYANAFEHSHSSIGLFSCGQYYPKRKELHLTIIDFGQGIPNNVRSLHQNALLDSAQALEWAFKPGTSTLTKKHNRGMGLSLLRNFVSTTQGSLKIFSNDSYVNMKDNKIIYEKKDIDFQGTLINIAFKCDESCYDLGADRQSTNRQWF
jgi:anti-anti-sigma regulatory factor/anti-sigma regulatory factor (Ser/Thr protein kinase)